MKRLLVLAPHQDDELLLAGALVYSLRKEYEIHVAYLTNGDSLNEDGILRMNEALCALKVLGVKKDNVVFFGYGNNWRGGKHIYNTDDHEVVISYAGKDETYGLENHPEYCYLKNGVHHSYTRHNIKIDLMELLLDLRADIIVCVDFDSHADHRALSLFFEEVMGEILKTSGNSYFPYVLKKFAYFGMNCGKWDYYSSPFKETAYGYREELLDSRYEMDNPSYRWEERIQFKVDKKTRTRLIHNNILYKAGKKYTSQKFADRVGKFANADIVYWQRRTDSLAYCANVSASSGDVSFVNDFKIIDCNDVLNPMESIDILSYCAWTPDCTDEEKALKFEFDIPIDVSYICFYENCVLGEDIIRASIKLDTGYEVTIDNIDHKGGRNEVFFETQQKGVNTVEFIIEKWNGRRYGITEFEIYKMFDDQIVPLERYLGSKDESMSIERRIDVTLERKIYGIEPDYGRDSIYYHYYKFLLDYDRVGLDRIAKWFDNMSIRTIAVYGYGEIGRKFTKDAINIGIDIKYGIDRMAGTMSATFPLYHPELIHSLSDVDGVVVTTTRVHFDSIMELLIKKGGVNPENIFLLEEIVYRA